MNSVVVGTSLVHGGPVAQRGYVDVMDCLRGVRGWAIDLTNPAQRQRVELCAGEAVIADMLTGSAP